VGLKAREICGIVILTAACISIVTSQATFWNIVAAVFGLGLATFED